MDPNSDVKMYESDAIIKYLYKTYGNNKVPFSLNNPFVGLSSFLASVVRGFRGIRKQKTNETVIPSGMFGILFIIYFLFFVMFHISYLFILLFVFSSILCIFSIVLFSILCWLFLCFLFLITFYFFL